jgi:hypothetical protein
VRVREENIAMADNNIIDITSRLRQREAVGHASLTNQVIQVAEGLVDKGHSPVDVLIALEGAIASIIASASETEAGDRLAEAAIEALPKMVELFRRTAAEAQEESGE